MRILIVSDTHRRNENFLQVIEMENPFDLVIHCGDVEGSEYVISQAAGCPVEFVQGNNDFFSDLPREKELTIGNYKVWVLHGHNYYVSMNYETIKNEALDRGVDIVMCGHTHRPVIETDGNLTIINPGSLSYPRQENRRPSYVIMELDEDDKPHYTLRYL